MSTLLATVAYDHVYEKITNQSLVQTGSHDLFENNVLSYIQKDFGFLQSHPSWNEIERKLIRDHTLLINSKTGQFLPLFHDRLKSVFR